MTYKTSEQKVYERLEPIEAVLNGALNGFVSGSRNQIN
jgi:hypothetical protein